MDVSKYQFDDDEIARLHNHRDNQPDARLKVRFIALLMLTEGVELKTIASIIGQYIKDHFKVAYSTETVRKLLKKRGLKVLRPKVVPGNPPSEEEQKKHCKIFRNETYQ